MKKLWAFLAVLLIVGEFTACGGDSGAPEKKSSAFISRFPFAGLDDRSAHSPAILPELGDTEDNCYENGFLGIGCRLNRDWHFTGREELASLSGIDPEGLRPAALEKTMRRAPLLYDLYAVSPDGTDTVQIIIWRPSGAQSGYSAEQLAHMAEEALPERMEKRGYSEVKVKLRDTELIGNPYHCVYLSAEISGIPYYCTRVYGKSGEYAAVIKCTSYRRDITFRQLRSFYSLS